MVLKDLNNTRYLAALFIFAVIETLIATGIIYGWANLVLILKSERFYLHLCSGTSSGQNITTHTQQVPQTNVSYSNQHCPAQDRMFNIIFTVSVKCFSVVMLPGGILIDRHGPFVSSMVSGMLFVVGVLGLCLTSIGDEGLLFPVFILISLAGNLQAGCLFKVCNAAFQRRKSLVLCVLNGALDSSSIIFVIFKLMYDAGYGFQQITMQYLCVCTLVIISGLIFFIPTQRRFLQWGTNQTSEESENTENALLHIKEAVDENNQVCSELTISTKSINTQVELKSNEIMIVPLTTAEDDRMSDSIWKSIISTLFIFHVIFLCTTHLKLVYFVGSLAGELSRISNNSDKTVNSYVDIFGYVQLGGLLVTPLLGILFDRHTFRRSHKETEEKDVISKEAQSKRKLKQCIMPLAVTLLLPIILCVLGLFETILVQIPQYIVYTIVRGFLYASHSAFIGLTFPGKHFGTLLGLGFFCAAICSLLNYALFELTLESFDGNSLYTNVILFVLVSCSIIHPVNIWWKTK